MPMILDGSNGVTFNDASLQGAAASPFGLKNRIINGDMRIDQRNAGAALTVNNGALFTLDRWMIEDGTTNGVLSVQQVSDAPTGYVNSLKVTASTGTGTIGAGEYSLITQHIEGFNMSDLAWGSASAVPVMVSFWVKATTTGTYSCTLYNSDANRINPQPFTINAANTWEYKTIAFTGETNGTWGTGNGRGIVFNIYTTIGTSYQSSAGWNSSSKFGVTGSTNAFVTTNNTFQITGVQLERGTSATPFERRMYGTELALCQRYFEKSYDYGTAIGANVVTDSQSVYVSASISQSKAWGTNLTFQVAKRSIPSVTIWNRAGTSGQWYWGALGVNEATGTTIIAGVSQYQLQVLYSSTYGAGANAGYGLFAADAEL